MLAGGGGGGGVGVDSAGALELLHETANNAINRPYRIFMGAEFSPRIGTGSYNDHLAKKLHNLPEFFRVVGPGAAAGERSETARSSGNVMRWSRAYRTGILPRSDVRDCVGRRCVAVSGHVAALIEPSQDRAQAR